MRVADTPQTHLLRGEDRGLERPKSYESGTASFKTKNKITNIKRGMRGNIFLQWESNQQKPWKYN